MVEAIQILLAASVVVLTSVLSLVGIQVFKILREVKKTVEKTNKIMDDAGMITESIARPASSIPEILLGMKSGFEFLGGFLRRRRQKEEENGE